MCLFRCQTGFLKRKFLRAIEGWFRLFGLRLLRLLMDLIGTHIDSFARPDRTGMFTGSASNADFVIDFRNHKLLFVWHHCYRFGRTMFGTCTTIFFLCNDDTIIFDKLYFSDLNFFFWWYIKRQNCAGRAYLAAKSTIEVAVAGIIIHFRLKDTCNSIFKEGREQHLRWTRTDAQMTSCTKSGESFHAQWSGRRNRMLTVFAKSILNSSYRALNSNDISKPSAGKTEIFNTFRLPPSASLDVSDSFVHLPL